jgi:hypothetical protein
MKATGRNLPGILHTRVQSMFLPIVSWMRDTFCLLIRGLDRRNWAIYILFAGCLATSLAVKFSLAEKDRGLICKLYRFPSSRTYSIIQIVQLNMLSSPLLQGCRSCGTTNPI